jgi:hypothetical protein
MRGREIGLTAMQSLTSIYIVEGKTSMSADLMAAKVLESGLAEYFEFSESKPETCTYITKRKGRTERSITWTIEQAQKAGVAGKDVWKKYPAAMLRHRAAADLARAVYPEVVLGLYDPDEIEPAEFPPPPPSAEGVRAVEMLHADIARVRAEIEQAARDMSPAMFERLAGTTLAKVLAAPVSALRKAHEALTAAGAFRAPEQAAQAPVVIDAQVVTSTPTPEPAKVVKVEVVPTTSTTQAPGADANQSPDPAQSEPADGEPSDTADGGGEEEPPPHAPETGEVLEPDAPKEIEVTINMLNAANAAARKADQDKAVAAFKKHKGTRGLNEISNPERLALLRELESIGGAS